ncbi:Gfo/Idh/MocA family oxidoreductase [Arthrobacter ruber]|uniref:Gfo/Idh/MocA family protein n=1 Tax=Arthrobacter ruber TaxID=1258893 RepID=UPI0014732FB6|nr:Gfo/Idh/MocA family oxidoreductase [Arthrobacter ruber]
MKAVLVGFGHAGRVFHAPLIAHDPDLELAAVVVRSPDRQRAARSDCPSAVVVATLEEALQAVPDAELAVIATPPATHAALAAAALGRGLHVVVEKPFVVHAEDGEWLIEAARAARRLLVPFHNRRWDGDFLTVQALVVSGALGRVRIVESAMESWKPSITKPWKRDAGTDDGGGVLYDLGSHLIDQALVLSGPAVPVAAELRLDRDDAAAEDSLFLVLEHDGGVTSHLRAGTLVPLARPRFHVTGTIGGLTITGTDPQEELLAAGVLPEDTAAAHEVGSGEGERGLLGRAGTTEPVRVGPGTYPSFYAGVVAAIRGIGPPPVAAEDAVAVVRIIEQVHASFPVRRATGHPPD